MCFNIYNVYDPSKIEDKLKVWYSIRIDRSDMNRSNLIMVGDLHAIMELDEKSGGMSKVSKVITKFRDFIEKIDVVDCVPKNGKYTWTNICPSLVAK